MTSVAVLRLCRVDCSDFFDDDKDIDCVVVGSMMSSIRLHLCNLLRTTMEITL